MMMMMMLILFFLALLLNINKIQQVHNTLAKIVLNDLSLPSVSALRQLHWLPINRRINFKIAILTYRALLSGTPSYLSSLINLNTTSRALRSSSLSLLHVPFTTTAIGVKLSDLSLQQFGIPYISVSYHYHLITPLNVA